MRQVLLYQVAGAEYILRYELDIAREHWKVQRYIECNLRAVANGHWSTWLVVKFPALAE